MSYKTSLHTVSTHCTAPPPPSVSGWYKATLTFNSHVALAQRCLFSKKQLRFLKLPLIHKLSSPMQLCPVDVTTCPIYWWQVELSAFTEGTWLTPRKDNGNSWSSKAEDILCFITLQSSIYQFPPQDHKHLKWTDCVFVFSFILILLGPEESAAA